MAFLRPVRSVETKLLLLVAGFVVTFVGYVVVRNMVLERVRINGPIYQTLKQRNALLADVARLHLLLAEIYFNAVHLLDTRASGDEAQAARLAAAHAALVDDYRSIAELWRTRPPDADTAAMLRLTVDSGTALLTLLDKEVVPAIAGGDVAGARRLLTTRGYDLFAAQRAASEQLALVSRQVTAKRETEAEQFAATGKLAVTLAGIGAIALFASLAMWGTRKVVLRPLRTAVRHFESIGRGIYTEPVQTDRTDEFGDMLRALDRMRGSLASMETELRTAEARYRTILERSVQGFYEVTPDGRLLSVNESLAAMLGYSSPAELTMVEAERLHVDPARRAELWRQIQERGFVSGFRAQLRRKDGRAIWVSEFARGSFDENGRCTHAEGFAEDITESVEAEQLKTEFVAFVTHQLRTPLSGIRWMVELAESEPVSPEVASFLEDARVSAERLISLVNELLDITRLEEGRMRSVSERIDLVALTGAVVTELAPNARAKQHTVAVSGIASASVFVDPQLIRQALMNCVSNAIKYTPEGGTIQVHTETSDGMVRWSVRDTGIGIPHAAQRRIFEKFFRAENAQIVDTEGTGLGLYMVRLIAERSGGSVSCESVEREGSTFTVTLPLVHERKAVA